MGKSLNDYVDDFFNGIIYVIFDYVRTLVILIFRPFRGYRLVLLRLRKKTTYQVRPHLFLFISYFLLLAIVPALYVFMGTDVSSLPHSAEGLVERWYRTGSHEFDASHLFPIILTAFGMVVIVEALTRAGSLAFGNRVRSRLFVNAAFFILGLQAILLSLANIAVAGGVVWRLDQIDHLTLFDDVIDAPSYLYHAYMTSHPANALWENIEVHYGSKWRPWIATSFLFVVMAISLPMFYRFLLRSLPARFTSVFAIVGAAILGIASIATIWLGSYVIDKISYREATSYEISTLKCAIEFDPGRVRAIITIHNPTDSTWTLDSKAFPLYVFGKPATGECHDLKTKLVDGSFGKEPSLIFLDAHKNYWLEIVSDAASNAPDSASVTDEFASAWFRTLEKEFDTCAVGDPIRREPPKESFCLNDKF